MVESIAYWCNTFFFICLFATDKPHLSAYHIRPRIRVVRSEQIFLFLLILKFPWNARRK